MFNRVCIFFLVLYSVELHSQKIIAKLFGQVEDILSFQVNFDALINSRVSVFHDKSFVLATEVLYKKAFVNVKSLSIYEEGKGMYICVMQGINASSSSKFVKL